ncbi:DUF6193 family natural product biosynthesis protein [Streptomyces sp. NPDC098789]|uniref:DUF6193 family natural product biosynthesis protein n=1 Tax=Streptomyces sp. NPDC098789 TaxID=3366098 RepID=UPI00381C2644
MSDTPPAEPPPQGPIPAYLSHYPEVLASGSLRGALQEAADQAGLPLAVELTSAPGWRVVAAQVTADDRSAQVSMSLGDRSFSVHCTAADVSMATGRTEELSEVIGALHSWMRGHRLRELVAQWPFLRTWEPAEAYERGDAVPARWRSLRGSAAQRGDTAMSDLLRAAFAEPRLRVLSPGRSMQWLTFSRRAAPPICHDLPRTMPVKGGGYRIRFTDGRLQDVDDAAGAVAIVLAGLPDDAVPHP